MDIYILGWDMAVAGSQCPERLHRPPKVHVVIIYKLLTDCFTPFKKLEV